MQEGVGEGDDRGGKDEEENLDLDDCLDDDGDSLAHILDNS